jgi:hypothetical protein
VNTNRYWTASITSGAANFINTAVRLTDSAVTATNIIGKSATVNGAYDSIGGSVAGSSVQSNTITSFGFFNIATGPTHTAPAITAASGLSLPQGAPATTSQIATVSDAETPAGSLIVTATTVPSGLSVTNIVNTNGTITADVAADCSAATGDNTVVLQGSDGPLTTNANLIINVTTNAAPTLTYSSQSVASGASLTINPATSPSDDLAIQSITLQSQGTYTGAIAVDNTTGVVSISSAAPEGNHSITIRATDNCGTTTDASFTLNVAPAEPTLGNYSNTSMNIGGNGNITPDAAPTNAARHRVSTSSAFTGLLTVDSTSGIVNVTNAQPAGIYTVTVTASDASGQTTRSFTLTVTTPVNSCTGFKTFVPAAASPFAAGGSTTVAAIGDFNGDGKQDLATTNSLSNNLTILLGDGAGGFTATASSPAVAGRQLFVAIGDFNGDGNQDLAITSVGSGNVSIRLGNGAGSFSNAPDVSLSNGTVAIVVGDFDGDGKQDLAISKLTTPSVFIRLGDGAGNFSSAPDVNVGASVGALAIGDFNANLIINVTANTAPGLAYTNQSVISGASLTISPSFGPSDDIAIQSIVVQSAGTYTGTISVHNSTGVISLSNAATNCTHTITIRATDSCGATTDASFTLLVGETRTLSVSKGGNASGIVRSTPAGVDCGPNCSGDFVDGASVSLTGIPDGMELLTSWDDDGTTVLDSFTTTMHANKSVIARFMKVSAQSCNFENPTAWPLRFTLGTAITPTSCSTMCIQGGGTGRFKVSKPTGTCLCETPTKSIDSGQPALSCDVTCNDGSPCCGSGNQYTTYRVGPGIAPTVVTQSAGSTASNSAIATVLNTSGVGASLPVTVSGDGTTFDTSAALNGLTVSNILVDASGQVTADVDAGCGATNAAFTLKVTQDSLANLQTLNVNVTSEHRTGAQLHGTDTAAGRIVDHQSRHGPQRQRLDRLNRCSVIRRLQRHSLRR